MSDSQSNQTDQITAPAFISLRRGDVVLVDLDGSRGTEKRNDATSKSRPCVVVQNDRGNLKSPLTIVVPLTDAKQFKDYREQVFVTAAELGSGGKDSVIECGHVRSIDRNRILKPLGHIDPIVLPRLDRALKASLGLGQ